MNANQDVMLRMRVLWGASVVTAGARMTAPCKVDVPVLVEGDTRPIHIPMLMYSGTIEELLAYIRAELTKTFAQAYELQQRQGVAFVDTGSPGLVDLTPNEPVPMPPPPETPTPLVSPETPAVPESIPADELPAATAELAPDPPAPVSEAVPPSAG